MYIFRRHDMQKNWHVQLKKKPCSYKFSQFKHETKNEDRVFFAFSFPPTTRILKQISLSLSISLFLSLSPVFFPLFCLFLFIHYTQIWQVYAFCDNNIPSPTWNKGCSIKRYRSIIISYWHHFKIDFWSNIHPYKHA